MAYLSGVFLLNPIFFRYMRCCLKFMVCVVFYFIVLISEGKDLFDKSVVMINVMIILIFVMTIVDPLVKLFTTAFSSYSKYHQKFTQNNKIIFYDDRIEYFQSKSMMIIKEPLI